MRKRTVRIKDGKRHSKLWMMPLKVLPLLVFLTTTNLFFPYQLLPLDKEDFVGGFDFCFSRR